jgi:hypothetical protein
MSGDRVEAEALMAAGEHNCSARHRTYQAMAKCLWPRAVWVEGEGPYATVSYCQSPSYRGNSTSVMLHKTEAAAGKAMAAIDRFGCGGGCTENHRLLELVLPEK